MSICIKMNIYLFIFPGRPPSPPERARSQSQAGENLVEETRGLTIIAKEARRSPGQRAASVEAKRLPIGIAERR
jgi:hypothetical protein